MKKFILVIALLIVGQNAFAAPLPTELDTLISTGINGIHSLEFAKAEQAFGEILEKYPGQPYGYFGKAMCAWARFEYEEEESNPALEKDYEQKTEEAIKKSNEWLKKNPKDAHAHLCVGGIYGLRSRLLVMKHSWLKAYTNGKKGLKHMKEALKLDPELHDAKLGPGMYEYYAGTLPGVIKVLAILFVRGNPETGIKLLKEVKDGGRYTSTAAKLLLIEIFTQTGSKYANPKDALVWAKELTAVYPNHPMIQFVEMVVLYESKKYDELRAQSLEYLKRINEEKPFYKKIYIPRVYMALATSYMAEKNWDEAMKYFEKSAEPLKTDKSPNRWSVWAVVRSGNIYDIKGKRDDAVLSYKKALQYEDTWGFREYIEKYLSRPYSIKESPGQLPPP
ncbi:MAG: hypothetical protein NTW04_02570 [Elusimicrobia bacterium]|nr:hypothetical protein [Elusimicrobiota bacterium]